VPSIRSSRPYEPDAAAAHTVIDEVLLLLIESGCQWIRAHPEVKLRLKGPRPDADVIAELLDPDGEGDA
jgi:hypothetical protein